MAKVGIGLEKTVCGGPLQPCSFASKDITEKLHIIANLKPGDVFPEEFGPNNWGSVISHVCAEAKEEIDSVRGQLEAALYAGDTR